MQRRPEPELMTDQLQVLAYGQADFSQADAALLEQLRPLLSAHRTGMKFVDLGCGPGNITLLLASAWPDAEVIGVDGSAPMLALACERNRQRSLNACFQERTLQSLVEEPATSDLAPADAIVSNSVLHHLHDPGQLWGVVRALGQHGTAVVHRDLRRPASEAELDRLQQQHLPEAPECLIEDYRASLRAAFTVAEVQAQLRDAGLEGLRVNEHDDRYLSVVGVL